MTLPPKLNRLGLAHRLLLSLPPEPAHRCAILALKAAQASAAGRSVLRRHAPQPDSRLEQTFLGLRFPNPVGLAAGFDKDGEIIAAAAELGFGLIEVGTVTPRPQRGNPRPRLFRHRRERSLENCMGFNNAGGPALRARLHRASAATVPLGINLGKNKDTPNEKAIDDYLELVEGLDGCCDYFVVNVSSPNTPGLRDLQNRRFLDQLLVAVEEVTKVPVFIKLSPDLVRDEAIDLVATAVAAGAAGAILTNTTAEHALLPSARRVGGLSGAVLRERSFALLDAVASELYGSCLLISVGGIESGREVYRRLRAGASLVQLYTALVYNGPGLLGAIASELIEHLSADGFESVGAAIGVDR
ncbi:MAG: quinone-dependent dihydroorotate dehydrogenase [Acidobacteriota bacterium]|nr:quinone-dependent dihydroorotate dehydrogenase [Acidobacteriota bacterium]